MQLITKSALGIGISILAMTGLFESPIMAAVAAHSQTTNVGQSVPTQSLVNSSATPSTSCSNPGLYFDGMISPTIQTAGAQADASRYDPRICEVSALWSMMDNQSNGNELAQVGWAKLAQWSTSTVYYFYEYGTSSTVYNPVMLSAVSDPTGGAMDKFTVFTNGSGVTEFLINNALQFSTTLDGTPNNVQWFGETHSYSDQTPGDTDHKVYVDNVQHLYAGTWYNNNAENQQYNDSPYGSGTWADSNYFHIWYTRYSSEN